MPAQGRGANLDTSRRIGATKAAPKLPKPPSKPALALNLRAPISQQGPQAPPSLPKPRAVTGAAKQVSSPKGLVQARASYEQSRPAVKRAVQAELHPKSGVAQAEGIGAALGTALIRGTGRIISHPKLAVEDVPKELKGEGALQLGAAAAGGAIHGLTAAALGRSGPIAAVGQEIAKLPSEAINLPTQIAPTIYQLGKAKQESLAGRPGAMGKVERGLEEGSLGKLIRLKPEAAAKQLVKTPVQSGLEYPGAAALIDRAVGLGAKVIGSDKAPVLAAEGPGPSRPARPLLGNLTEAQRPYGKGFVQNLVQRSKDLNPKPPGETMQETLLRRNLSTRIRRHVDLMEGRFHGAMRQAKVVASKQRALAIKGPRTINGKVLPGVDAINLFNHGILSDPAVKVGKGATWHGQPLSPDMPRYQLQLSELAEHLSKQRPDETVPDPERLAALGVVERIKHDTGFHRNPFPAYKSALKMAQDKATLEPGLQRLYGYTPKQMRGAKLAQAFQFHWRDEDPWIEHAPPLNEAGQLHQENIRRASEFNEARQTSHADLVEARARHANAEITDRELHGIEAAHKRNVLAHKDAVTARKGSAPTEIGEHHESPYSISDGKGGRTHLTQDEVLKGLAAKGVNEQQLAFMSHRPFRSAAGDLHPPPGTARSGVAAARGFRSGKAFLEGHADMTHDAMARQYISDTMRLEREHQNTVINRELGLTTRHAADLLEKSLTKAPDADRAAIQARIERLRSGSTFFKPEIRRITTPNGTTTAIRTSAWQQAQAEAARLKSLNPDLNLVPYRVASPWAPGGHLEQIAQDAGDAHIHDVLAPDNWEKPTGLNKFQEPYAGDRGEVGLMHKAARDRLVKYEKMMGSSTNTVLGNMSTFWRKNNVAWSQKHIPGITQELGLRALAYKAGIGNALRGYKALKDFAKAASDPHFRVLRPEIDHYLRELEHMSGGGVIQQSFDQTRHLPMNRLENTALGKLAGAFEGWKAHKATGFPARMLSDLAGGYMKVTESILKAEQAAIGKPFRVAGMGKALDTEAKRITGKHLPMFKATDQVMREFIKGQFNPKSIDHLANVLNEAWGDFQTATPGTRQAQVISPFWTWYRQALKFVYHTLPVHHPIKTAILASLEGATEEQRRAEGQGYTKTLGLRPEGLQAAQQGSVPSFRKNGNRWELQYYTPVGSVSKGVEGMSELFPYVEEIPSLLKGRSGFTGRELPGHPEGLQLVLMALGSLAEGFFPVTRKAKLIAEGKAEKAFLPIRDNPARNPKGELIQQPEAKAPTLPSGAFEGSTAATDGSVYER